MFFLMTLDTMHTGELVILVHHICPQANIGTVNYFMPITAIVCDLMGFCVIARNLSFRFIATWTTQDQPVFAGIYHKLLFN